MGYGFAKAPQPGTVPVGHVDFKVLDGHRFGQVEPLTVTVREPTLLTTNVQPFPWNRIRVDALPLPQSSIIATDDGLAVILPAGSHRVEAEFLYDRTWTLLDRLSWVTLLLWLALYVACAAVECAKMIDFRPTRS